MMSTRGLVHAAAAVGMLGSAMLLGGCGSAPAPAQSPVTASGEVSSGYLCAGVAVDVVTLHDRPPLVTLDPRLSEAMGKAVWDDGSPLVVDDEDKWFVAQAHEDEITIMRPLAVPVVPDIVDRPPRDMAVLSVVRIDDASNLAPGWYVGSSGHCAMTLDLGGLSVPAISLNSASPPDSSDTRIDLLVTEQGCNSGQDAQGRVEVVGVKEGEATVDIVIGIRPRGGNANCPTNPPTPLTITLDAPLGDRTLMNATLATPRPLTPFEPMNLG